MKSMAQAGSPVYPGHCFGQLLISVRNVTRSVCQRGEKEKPGLCS
jgi:hypothetical protein